MSEQFKPTHRHYKGALYQFLHLGRLEADLTLVVVYRDASGLVWVRPEANFRERLEDGRQRFAPLSATPSDA